jgi:hypothetical protein
MCTVLQELAKNHTSLGREREMFLTFVPFFNKADDAPLSSTVSHSLLLLSQRNTSTEHFCTVHIRMIYK